MIYYTTRRPAGPGAVPMRGLVQVIETYPSRRELEFCTAWSKLEYDRELTEEELRSYEMDDNSPKAHTYIDLKKYDPVLVFTGTDEEKADAEKKSAENDKLLTALYDAVLKKDISYVFTSSKSIRDGKTYANVNVLTNASKYKNALQLTSIEFIDGDFAYMNGDARIKNANDFIRELVAYPGKRIYYVA